eukprot:7843558-Pyramimonas_sp.AAC.1
MQGKEWTPEEVADKVTNLLTQAGFRLAEGRGAGVFVPRILGIHGFKVGGSGFKVGGGGFAPQAPPPVRCESIAFALDRTQERPCVEGRRNKKTCKGGTFSISWVPRGCPAMSSKVSPSSNPKCFRRSARLHGWTVGSSVGRLDRALVGARCGHMTSA